MCSQEQEIFCKNKSQDTERDLGGCWVLCGGAGEGTELPKVLPQAAETNPALWGRSLLLGSFGSYQEWEGARLHTLMMTSFKKLGHPRRQLGEISSVRQNQRGKWRRESCCFHKKGSWNSLSTKRWLNLYALLRKKKVWIIFLGAHNYFWFLIHLKCVGYLFCFGFFFLFFLSYSV